jgi:hypothetical protein
MAHFAELDSSNVVKRVVVIANKDTSDANNNEVESIGVAFCQSLFGSGTWIQTSYNSTIRKNYAGVGFSYRADIDAFVSPQPYPSWVLDMQTAKWSAPVAYPNDGKVYEWNEPTLSWVEIQVP